MTVQWNDQMFPQLREAAARGVASAITAVERRSVELILETPKTGRIYDTLFFTVGSGPGRRVIPYGSRTPHQASAPGEPPASDTGRLVNSRRIDFLDSGLRARLNYSTAYAAYLEFGTDRMEPRPFLRRALAESGEEIHRRIKAEIVAALQ